MRAALIALAACGAPAPIASPTPPPRVTPAQVEPEVEFTPIDPIAGLALDEEAEVSWITPGQARIELAATPIDPAPDGSPMLPVTVLDRQAKLVRVAIRLPHARFSLWMDRERMAGVMTRSERLHIPNTLPNDPAPMLHAGARVVRLAREGENVRVRYVGSLEVEGVVPASAVAERGSQHPNAGRIPSGSKILTVVPGSIIRSAPTWNGTQIALAANGYFVDEIRVVDDRWVEVRYRDGDIDVRGFFQKFSPPGRAQRTRVDPETVPAPIAANAKVANGTCLYARANGEPVGYIVDERDVALDQMANGWWTLAVDTPWGPITFAARGPSSAELAKCRPATSP